MKDTNWFRNFDFKIISTQIMSRFLFLFIAFVSILQIGLAQQNDQLLQEALTLTKAGDNQKAIDKFESLEEHGSADIYYNLGRLYQENNNIAKAALNYERALRLESGHAKAINNLSIIREETDFDIIPVEEMFLIRWWKGLAGSMSANFWMILSLLVGIGLIVALYFWWIADRPELKKKAFFATLITPVLLAVILALGNTSKLLATNTDYAIVMNADYDLHEGADDRSPIVKDVEAGTKVEIVDQINDWIKVVTADTESGWLKASEVERI